MERQDKQIGIIALAGAAVLAVASGVMWLRDGPPASPELRAAVHAVCPFGGQPYSFSTDNAERTGQVMGIGVSAALIESQPLYERVVFCTALMWK